jgi:hypothetical protein
MGDVGIMDGLSDFLVPGHVNPKTTLLIYITKFTCWSKKTPSLKRFHYIIVRNHATIVVASSKHITPPPITGISKTRVIDD